MDDCEILINREPGEDWWSVRPLTEGAANTIYPTLYPNTRDRSPVGQRVSFVTKGMVDRIVRECRHILSIKVVEIDEGHAEINARVIANRLQRQELERQVANRFRDEVEEAFASGDRSAVENILDIYPDLPQKALLIARMHKAFTNA